MPGVTAKKNKKQSEILSDETQLCPRTPKEVNVQMCFYLFPSTERRVKLTFLQFKCTIESIIGVENIGAE